MKHPTFEIFQKVQKDVMKSVKIKDIRKKYNISRYIFDTFYRDPKNGDNVRKLEESRILRSGHKELSEKSRAKKAQNSDIISKKELCLSLLEKSLGNVSQACKAVGIGRQVFYLWLADDPEFKQRYEDQQEAKLDFAESKLNAEMNDGNITALIFFLKTKGQKRGYMEKKEIDLKGSIIIRTDSDDDEL